MSEAKEKQKIIESKHRQILMNSASAGDFAEAYDEIHRFFIKERDALIYRDDLSSPAMIVINKYEPPIRLLEIGTGNGFSAIELAKKGFEVTTIDISKVALEVAKRRVDKLKLPLRIQYGDARDLQFNENFFDCVISSSLVEHLSTNDAKTHLLEVKRVLKPQCGYYFYAGNRLKKAYESAGLHLKMYSTEEQIRLADSLGFETKFIELRIYKNLIRSEFNSCSFFLKIIYLYEKKFEMLHLTKLSKNIRSKLLPNGVVCAYKKQV
jgi:ubiquinone/menaquinone biosynthesis C-methylase UbiE